MYPLLLGIVSIVGIFLFFLGFAVFNYFCDWIIYRISPFKQPRLTFRQWLQNGCPRAEDFSGGGK